MCAVEVEKEDLIIDTRMPLDDLATEPVTPSRYYTDNIFRRALSLIQGWTGTRLKLLRCTLGGVLKVASTGGGLEYQEVKTGTSANAYLANPVTFTETAARIIIRILSNNVYVKIYRSDGAYNDEFLVYTGTEFAENFVAAGFNIKSAVGGAHGTYEIIGAW